jgi:hypothetical protein
MCREITYHIAPFAKGRTDLPFWPPSHLGKGGNGGQN